MDVEIKFPSYDANNRAYVTWRPVEVTLRLANAPQGTANLPVTVAAKTTPTGGRLAFATMLTHLGATNIGVTLPGNGNPVSIWVGGLPKTASTPNGGPSTNFADVSVEVRATATGQVLATHPTMVRVRKNANTLSVAERDRFISAMARLNGSGTGRYKDFRDMHVTGLPNQEAHGGPGFLAWHRAYLLDLERELQALEAEVTLPYWRFDQAAPNVISLNFMGVPDGSSRIRFASGHPFLGWSAFGANGIDRGAGVGPNTIPNVFTEKQTVAPNNVIHPNFASFRNMQGNPHGGAHTSHGGGWIFSIGTAARDPLFFLLHCNVDRLWAKWQWVAKKHNPGDAAAFDVLPNPNPGHSLNDMMWPWCGPFQPGRPQDAPGGGLAASPMTAAPGANPRVRQMIDYLGTVSAEHLGFAYDDVPFQK